MAGSAQEDEDMIGGINVTPLVDITLVLLIIFIATSSIIVKAEMGMELPSAATAEDSKTGPINIQIFNKEIFYNNELTRADQLQTKLEAEYKRDKNVKALVSADKHMEYGEIAKVVDAIRKAGISSFSLDVQRTAE